MPSLGLSWLGKKPPQMTVVAVNVETHCMRLFVVSTFSLRIAVSRRMQCVSIKILKFLNINLSGRYFPGIHFFII
ncbi:MAG: hypothetical protein CV080_08545 [Candidatus Kuenenia stuttgartiensis]|nr:MAG: hypothetical protein CV080_08545 [Candidatus Kuenenia stuttgartiensis]